MMTDDGVSRRRALAGVAGVGFGVPILAACSGRGTTAGDAPPAGTPESGGGAGSGMSGALTQTSEVPEGSGVVLADEGVVVTQPSAGEFRAFSVVCTHQGCPVNEVTDTINCPCHGSSFGLEDGAPQDGPASEPLAEVPITVEGDQIRLG
jgi:Rieske Fe-S protein